MNELSNVFVGLLVPFATFFITKFADGIKTDALRTMVKGLMALGVAFILAILQLVITTTGFTWAGLWGNLPTIVAVALGFYGTILKPATELKNPTL